MSQEWKTLSDDIEKLMNAYTALKNELKSSKLRESEMEDELGILRENKHVFDVKIKDMMRQRETDYKKRSFASQKIQDLVDKLNSPLIKSNISDDGRSLKSFDVGSLEKVSRQAAVSPVQETAGFEGTSRLF